MVPGLSNPVKWCELTNRELEKEDIFDRVPDWCPLKDKFIGFEMMLGYIND